MKIQEGCARIESLEVTRNRLLDARCDAQEIVALDCANAVCVYLYGHVQ